MTVDVAGRVARLVGEIGDVVVGRRADLLLTDAELVPRAVLRAGRWVAPLPVGGVPSGAGRPEVR